MPYPEIEQHHRDLAKAMPLSEHSFAERFRIVQRSDSPVLFDAFGSSDDPFHERVGLAFSWAEAEGPLPDLVRDIAKVRYSKCFLEAASRIQIHTDAGDLQSIVDPDDPMLHTELFGNGLIDCANQICRVLVDGRPMGTGFLVAPRVVATACHVLDALIDKPGEPKTWTGLPGTSQRIQFEFGNTLIKVNGQRMRNDTQRILAHESWLISASECHSDERAGRLPSAGNTLSGHFDYVLCRLASIVAVDKRGLDIDREAQFGSVEKEHITVVQHPDGKSMRHHRGEATRIDPPRHRVNHAANTYAGSSGAPCLNDEMKVVAMHQAGAHNGPDQNQPVPEGQFSNRHNRCVPISWMLNCLDNLAEYDAGLMPIVALENHEPVIGRSDLINWLHDTVSDSGAHPILTVESNGLPGMRFTVRIMKALLSPEKHRVLHLSIRDLVGRDVSGVVEMMCEKLGLPQLPGTAEPGLAAPAAQMRYEEFDHVLNHLTQGGSFEFWMAIDSYDHEALDDTPGGVRDLFDRLLDRAGSTNHLRFVLLQRRAGYTLPYTIAATERQILRAPSQAEIEAYIRMSFESTHNAELVTAFAHSVLENAKTIDEDASYYRKLLKCFGIVGP